MPRPNNLNRLYRMFVDAYNNSQNASFGVPVSTIMSEFHWTETTVRSMVSNIRREYQVTIRFRRWNNDYRLIAPSRYRDINGNITVPVVTAPVQVQENNAVNSETAEILNILSGYCIPEAARSECSNWTEYLHRAVFGSRRNSIVESFLPQSQYANVRERVRTYIYAARHRASRIAREISLDSDVTTCTRALTIGLPPSSTGRAEQAHSRSNREVTQSDTLVSLANELRIVSHNCTPFGARNWEDWITQRINSNISVNSYLTGETYDTHDRLAERVRAFIAAQRERNSGSNINPTPVDTLWAGIPSEVSNYYRERAMEFGN